VRPRRRGDAEPALDRAEQAAPACVISVLSEKLDTAGDPDVKAGRRVDAAGLQHGRRALEQGRLASNLALAQSGVAKPVGNAGQRHTVIERSAASTAGMSAR